MFVTIPLYDDTPRRRVPLATYGLIGACALVFLWQAGLSPSARDHVALSLGLVPAVLFGHAVLSPELRLVPPWATVFTSMFLHGGWLHLGGNMLYLWIFGKGVETALGVPRYLALYFLCGAIAALTQAGMSPASHVPMIGASGAIAGVLGAYLVLYPRSNVVVFVWIIILVRLVTVPAVILLGIWFLLQLMSAGAASAAEAGVAFWAHVGGFLAGIALVLVLRRSGTAMWQPPRSRSFQIGRPRDLRSGFGRGSVPSAGRRRGERQAGPWG
jgi:membrane associated rhomboid family serine protease